MNEIIGLTEDLQRCNLSLCKISGGDLSTIHDGELNNLNDSFNYRLQVLSEKKQENLSNYDELSRLLTKKDKLLCQHEIEQSRLKTLQQQCIGPIEKEIQKNKLIVAARHPQLKARLKSMEDLIGLKMQVVSDLDRSFRMYFIHLKTQNDNRVPYVQFVLNDCIKVNCSSPDIEGDTLNIVNGLFENNKVVSSVVKLYQYFSFVCS